MTPCMGWGRLFGHRFKARYNTISEWPEGTRPRFTGTLADDSAELVEALKNRRSTYAADVCTRCGMTVNHWRGS